MIIVDMQTGQATIEQPLEDLVKERTASDPTIQFTLYSVDWLPEHRLVVNYTGAETYSYDPHTKTMEMIPRLGWVISVSDGGTIYRSGTEPEGGKPLIWNGSTTQVLELDKDSGYALEGAFNVRGDALAIELVSPQHQPQGWQLFRLNQGQWMPSGPVAKNSWMKAAPRALSNDGAFAYTALEGGLPWKNGQHAALLSYSFQTGSWQEWLGPDNALVDLGEYPFVAIVPGF